MIITHLVSLTMYFVSSSCSHKTHCLTLELFHSISQTLRQVITKPAFLEAYACMYGHWRNGHTTFVNLPIWHAISKNSLSTYRHMNTILLSSSSPQHSVHILYHLRILSHHLVLWDSIFIFVCDVQYSRYRKWRLYRVGMKGTEYHYTKRKLPGHSDFCHKDEE